MTGRFVSVASYSVYQEHELEEVRHRKSLSSFSAGRSAKTVLHRLQAKLADEQEMIDEFALDGAGSPDAEDPPQAKAAGKNKKQTKANKKQKRKKSKAKPESVTVNPMLGGSDEDSDFEDADEDKQDEVGDEDVVFLPGLVKKKGKRAGKQQDKGTGKGNDEEKE